MTENFIKIGYDVAENLRQENFMLEVIALINVWDSTRDVMVLNRHCTESCEFHPIMGQYFKWRTIILSLGALSIRFNECFLFLNSRLDLNSTDKNFNPNNLFTYLLLLPTLIKRLLAINITSKFDLRMIPARKDLFPV